MSEFFLNNNLPELFTFTQKILYSNIKCFETDLQAFLDNFHTLQDQTFYDFWEKRGEQILLQQWNIKYKNHLAYSSKNTYSDSDSTDKSDKQLEAFNEAENVSGKEVKDDAYTWDDQWQKHIDDVYFETYELFSCVCYNYYLIIKKAIEKLDEVSTDEKKEFDQGKDTNSDTANKTGHNTGQDWREPHTDWRELHSLGLPTNFGTKKGNQIIRNQAQFKDIYYSDDDNESFQFEMSSNSGDDTQDSFHYVQNRTISKPKSKRYRNLRNVPDFIRNDKSMLKYWRKRFSLFSRYDEGIQLDQESWFSVTPEKIAVHIAERLACDVIVDGFCGCGGNTIQFAKTCRKVIAIDIDPLKLQMAQHNAQVYGVADKIEFILADFLQVCDSFKFKSDIVFVSPPWGGPKYKKKSDYDIEQFLLPVGASELVEKCRKICQNIALFLPRNANMHQIIKLAGAGNRCEVVHNYLDTRLVAITAMYGENIIDNKEEV